jgi:predicted O-methyltransferase YrrM
MAAGVAGGGLTLLAALPGWADPGLAVPVSLVLAGAVASAQHAKLTLWGVLHGHLRRIERDLTALERFAHRRLPEIEGLVQLSAVPTPYPLPFGGGWALGADNAAILAREVKMRRPRLVLELGSGVSTLLVGLLLKEQGGGRLISLDHEAEWAAETRRQVAALGLASVVGVVDAPLEEQTIGGERQRWYRLPAEMPADGSVDLLVVDGPPQSTDPSGLPRYPALPVLARYLSERAIVFIDDAARMGEAKMLARWAAELPGWRQRTYATARGAAVLERTVP